jgi:hypothetical protein
VPFTRPTGSRPDWNDSLPPAGRIWCSCIASRGQDREIPCEFFSSTDGALAFSGSYFANPAPREALERLDASVVRVDGFEVILREGQLSPKKLSLGKGGSMIYDYF